jgi:hypothetical protein
MKRSPVPRIDPKILELVKKDYGETCELVNRTEWSYTFERGPESDISISRFMAEKGFEVSAAEIREQWPQWDQCQRIDFAFNWHTKGTWTDNDTEILEIIMADGDDDVWQRCTEAFLKHPDRNRAVSFLVDRVLHYLGVQEDVFSGPIPYFPYFVIAGALFKITGSPEYEQSIRKFFDHENEGVRFWAELALEIEGPTTEFFNAGRRKPTTLESEVKSFTYQRGVRTTWFGAIIYRIGVTYTGLLTTESPFIGILRRFFPQRWIYQLKALSPEPLIYFQVLGIAKDTRSVAAIRPFYEKYKKIVDTEPVTA